MVYLIGRINKIGGISGKRVYFKEIRGIGFVRYCLYSEKIEDDGFIYGSTHCFDCLVSLIEKALYIHNDNSLVIIKIENDLIIEMKAINEERLMKIAEESEDSMKEYYKFNNQVIEKIVNHFLK